MKESKGRPLQASASGSGALVVVTLSVVVTGAVVGSGVARFGLNKISLLGSFLVVRTFTLICDFTVVGTFSRTWDSAVGSWGGRDSSCVSGTLIAERAVVAFVTGEACVAGVVEKATTLS